MNKSLLDILVCPQCKSKIKYSKDGKKLICVKCKANYFTKNNVPILLAKNNKKLIKNVLKSSVKEESQKDKLVSKIIGSDFIAKNPLKRWWKTLVNRNGAKTKILDIGSGSRRLDEKVVNMDIELFSNVDIVGDAQNIPFKDRSFDTIWIEAVLEHVNNPSKVVSEIHRILKNGGYVFAVIPFIHKYHEHPNDFQRYSISGIEELFSRFKKEELGVYRGPTSALLSFLSEYCTLFSKNKTLNRLIKGLVFGFLFPIRHFDIFLVKNKRAHELANALYYIGRKV